MDEGYTDLGAASRCKKAEMRARRGAVSIRAGAYLCVRNRMDTEPQQRIATQMRRFSILSRRRYEDTALRHGY